MRFSKEALPATSVSVLPEIKESPEFTIKQLAEESGLTEKIIRLRIKRLEETMPEAVRREAQARGGKKKIFISSQGKEAILAMRTYQKWSPELMEEAGRAIAEKHGGVLPSKRILREEGYSRFARIIPSYPGGIEALREKLGVGSSSRERPELEILHAEKESGGLSPKTGEMPQEEFTVKELAKETGLSPEAILYRIRSLEKDKPGEVRRKPQARGGNRKIFVSREGKEAILVMRTRGRRRKWTLEQLKEVGREIAARHEGVIPPRSVLQKEEGDRFYKTVLEFSPGGRGDAEKKLGVKFARKSRGRPEPGKRVDALTEETRPAVEIPKGYTNVGQLVRESGWSKSTILRRISMIEAAEEISGEIIRVVEQGRKRIYIGPEGRKAILAMGRKRAELQDEDLLTDLGPSEINNIVALYLKEIGKTPLLTAEEEIELAKQIKKGKEANLRFKGDGKLSSQEEEELKEIIQAGNLVRERFIRANGRLVVSIARRYIGRGLPFSDLIQEGNIGLMKAVDRFDYTRGNKFSTYATWLIRQAITRAIADQGRTIRLPAHRVEGLNKLSGVSQKLTKQLGRPPTDEEVAVEMNTTPKRIEKLKEIAQQPVSLEMPVGEENTPFGDFVEDEKISPPPDAAADEILKKELDDVLSSLTPREEGVLKRRSGLYDGRSWTLEEVGEEFGVTRERIRQIEAKALRKLRHPYRSRKLRDYL